MPRAVAGSHDTPDAEAAIHHSFMPDPGAVIPGQRFLAATPGYPSRREYRFLTAVERVPGEALAAVNDQGLRLSFPSSGPHTHRESESGEKLSPYWTLPLPALPDEETIRFVEAFTRSGETEPPFVVHVGKRKGGFVEARLAFTVGEDAEAWHAEAYADALPDAEPAPSWTRHGHMGKADRTILIPEGEMPEGAAEGDVVVSPSFRCAYEDGTLVTRFSKGRSASGLSSAPVIAAKGVSEEGLGDLFPRASGRGPGRFVFRDGLADDGQALLTDPDRFEEEAWNARLRLEPDEMLVLWYREPGSRDTACHVLGHTGYLFSALDSLSDLFYGNEQAEGLWKFTDAKAWSSTSCEGEHDFGVDGDFMPAEVSDFDGFGFTAESLREEIADVLADTGVEFREDGLVERMIGLADAAVSAEKAKAEATAPAAPTA